MAEHFNDLKSVNKYAISLSLSGTASALGTLVALSKLQHNDTSRNELEY